MGRRFVPAEDHSINPFTTRQSKKNRGWIILLALGFCWMAVTGCNLLNLLTQSDSMSDNLSEDQQDGPVPSIDSTILEEGGQPAQEGQSGSSGSQPGVQTDTILAVTDSGIWAVNEKTHEAIQISEDPLNTPWDLNEGMSPDKRFFAYITGFKDASAYPMLVVLDIENHVSILQLELSGPILKAGQAVMDSGVGDPPFEAFRAMQYSDSIAWSPDGTKLAFIGAREGDSADVYIFDPAGQSVTRVTDEAGHAFELNWSPDGQLLEYLSANSFGTGAGAEMVGLWIYEVQSNQYLPLENLETSGETFLTWTDNTHFLIASWSSICENHNLRLVNAARFFNEPIVNGCFSGIAYDPERKHGLFAVTEFNSNNCGGGDLMEPGLMVFGEKIGNPAAGEIGYKKFELFDAYTVRFLPQGNLFVVYGWDGQQYIYNDQLANMEIPAEFFQYTPYVSPTGDYWVWASRAQNGLWITTERNMNPVELPSFFSGVPVWSTDGESFYFYEFNRLFSTSAPQFSGGTLVVEIPGVEIVGLVK